MSVQPLTATTGDITADTTAPTQMIGTQTTKSIIDYAADLEAAFKLANAICGTSFVPKHFQGKPHETAIAMMPFNLVPFKDAAVQVRNSAQQLLGFGIPL